MRPLEAHWSTLARKRAEPPGRPRPRRGLFVVEAGGLLAQVLLGLGGAGARANTKIGASPSRQRSTAQRNSSLGDGARCSGGVQP